MGNKGGFSWKRATGITRAKQNFSRKTGIPMTKSGRQRKIGKAMTGGGCLFYLVAPLIVLGILITLLTAGCGSGGSTTIQQSNKEFTLSEMASKENARVGALYRVKRAENGVTLNFMEIINCGSQGYTLNNGKHLDHAVVIATITGGYGDDLENVRSFIKDVGYFALTDKYGNKNNDLTIWTQTGKFDATAGFAPTEIILEAKSSVSGYVYLLVGGYDRDRNDGKSKTIFSIGQ